MNDAGLAVSALVFLVASCAVWLAGTRLTRFVDQLAERKNLDRALLGAFVLATVTQLPELVTNITAAYRGDARLALNGMFGGVSMQTAVLVFADAVALRYALTHLSRRPSNLVLAATLIALLSLVLGVSVTGDVAIVGHVGLGPIALAACYGLAMWLTAQVEQETTWRVAVEPQDEDHRPGAGSDAGDASVTRLIAGSAVASIVILGAGIALVLSAESIAAQTGLGNSFVGVTLLASATSLPEVSTTVTAVRLRQYSMALADIFGSNLIMVGLLLPTDIFYREGAILDQIDDSARFALVLGIFLTAAYLMGLVLRKPRKWLRLGADSWVVLVAYALGLAVLYGLRQAT